MDVLDFGRFHGSNCAGGQQTVSIFAQVSSRPLSFAASHKPRPLISAGRSGFTAALLCCFESIIAVVFISPYNT